METRFHDFIRRTVGIIAFGRDEDPVDIIESAEVADKVCLRVGRTDNDYTFHTCFARCTDSVGEIFECEIVGVLV